MSRGQDTQRQVLEERWLAGCSYVLAGCSSVTTKEETEKRSKQNKTRYFPHPTLSPTQNAHLV